MPLVTIATNYGIVTNDINSQSTSEYSFVHYNPNVHTMYICAYQPAWHI